MLDKNLFIGLGLGYLAAKAAKRNPSGRPDLPAIKRWRKEFVAPGGSGIEEFKREVADYADDHGSRAAAREFGVSQASVLRWRKRLGDQGAPRSFGF
jgi:hypothetical protein